MVIIENYYVCSFCELSFFVEQEAEDETAPLEPLEECPQCDRLLPWAGRSFRPSITIW